MWLTSGFAVSCGLGVWVLPANGVVLTALSAALLTALSLKFGPKQLGAALLGCTVGLCWYLCFMKLYLIPAHAMDGMTIRTTVTATSYSYDTDYGVGVDGEFSLDGKNHKMRLYVNGVEEIAPGDVIDGAFQLRYTAPGGMRDPTYHAGDGILFLGYPRGNVELRRSLESKGAYRSEYLRYGILRRLEAIFRQKPRRWRKRCFWAMIMTWITQQIWHLRLAVSGISLPFPVFMWPCCIRFCAL